jgi:Predicted metal-binding integral membrane protein (DUF2182)
VARHPGTLPIVASVVAWAVLVVAHPAVLVQTVLDQAVLVQTVLDQAVLDQAVSDQAVSDHAGSGHGSVFTLAGIAHTAAMTVAMMAPFALSGVRTAAFTSLWWRAGRAAMIFLAAFLLTWTVIALCLDAVAMAWTTWLGSASTGTAVLLGVCALAQLDPTRPEQVKRCDRGMRLRATGSEADVDCARFGVLTAGRDVRFCALPMLAMLAADQLPASLLVMAAVTALALADRITAGRRRLLIAAAYAAFAVVLVWWG